MSVLMQPRVDAGLLLDALPDARPLIARPLMRGEALRDPPGLVLLESARPGRRPRWSYLAGDPMAVLDEPGAGADPFAEARSLLRRASVGSDRADLAPPLDVRPSRQEIRHRRRAG